MVNISIYACVFLCQSIYDLKPDLAFIIQSCDEESVLEYKSMLKN